MSTAKHVDELPDDKEFVDETIERVTPAKDGDGCTITFDGGVCFFVERTDGITPKVGDVARFYGPGRWRPIRGLAIDGKIVFHRTVAEQEAKHEADRLAEQKRKQDELEKNRPELTRRVAALPTVLRRRIERFEKGCATFWRDFLPYELFCCEQAVAISDHFRPISNDAFLQFTKKKFEEQIAEVPAIGHDHSGNTFGMACRLAWWLLTKPENAALEHGALTPLVGCVDYGCTHENDPKPAHVASRKS